MKKHTTENISQEEIDEFLSGNINIGRIKAVREWMKTDEGQKQVSIRMDKDITSAVKGEHPFSSVAGEKAPYDIMLGRINRSMKRRRTIARAGIAAAVILPLLVMNFFLLSKVMDWGGTVAYEQIYVPAGEQLKLLMSDGTGVTLNSGTTFHYPAKFARKSRTVMIEGEGWFEVAKDSKKPFIVSTETVDIQVLGTEFNVSTDSGNGEMNIYLASGVVKIGEKISGLDRTVTLYPGQTAHFQKSTGLCYVDNQDGTHTADQWRHKRYHFKDAPLADLIGSIEKSYGVTFEITSEELYRYTYTISFFNESVDDIINAMEQITPIACVRVGDRIIINPKR